MKFINAFQGPRRSIVFPEVVKSKITTKMAAFWMPISTRVRAPVGRIDVTMVTYSASLWVKAIWPPTLLTNYPTEMNL